MPKDLTIEDIKLAIQGESNLTFDSTSGRIPSRSNAVAGTSF